jgi:signal transduction histidine kinase
MSVPSLPSRPPRGFVARFTAHGDLLDVLLDPLERLSGLPGVHFLALLDEGSRAKGELLLDRVREAGFAFDWELLLGDDDGSALRLTIIEDEGHLLVLGSPAGEDLESVLNGLTGCKDLVVNRLRELEAAHARMEDRFEVPAELDRELVNLHRELARRTAQLEEANERKSQLLGMAAHDLRNPIGAIRGFAQLLLARVSPRLDERERMVLERIERSSDHMLELVNDLLQLSEVDRAGLAVSIERTACDVAALVARSVEVDRVLAEQKDISIDLELGCDELLAVIDGGKLEQVLANLLSNAIKFSDPGSAIGVVLDLDLDGDAVVVEVRDEGPGIPEDEYDLVFEPFARTSVRPTGGERSTGLGLAIVHRIVEGHGGRIEVDTEVGVGSTFRVLLPRSPDVVVPRSRQRASGSSSPARSQPTTARIPS